MGYRLGDKEIKLTGKRMTKIGTGVTGDVYKYKNNALKIFKDNKEIPIDLETAQYLSQITTHRILLPKNLLFYNNSFKGYSYKLVSKKGLGKRILTIPSEDLTEEISIIEKDIERLSTKKVLLNGIEPSNIIFNGKLYLADPSKYSVLDLYSTQDLEVLNKYQLHLLLTTMITSEIRKNNFGSKIEKEIKELLEIKDTTDNCSDFIRDIIGNNDNMKQLIKKMQ